MIASSFQLMKNRPSFRWLFLASSISILGTPFTRTASAVLALRLTGQALPMTVVFLCSFLPGFVIAPIAGSWVDRWNKRNIMVITSLVQAGAVAGMMVATRVWHLGLLAFLAGTAACIFNPAYQAALPETVDTSEIMTANQLSELTAKTAEMLGALLAAGWLTLVSIQTAFAVDALSFVVAALLMWTGMQTAQPEPTAEANPGGTTFWSSVKDGFAYAVKEPLVSRCLLVSFIATVAITGVIAILPVFAREVLGHEEQWGVLDAAMTVGCILGAFAPAWVSTRIGRGATVVVGSLGMAVGLLLPLAVPSLSVVVGGFVLGGVANSLYYITFRAWLQEKVSRAYLGRVLAIRTTVSTAATTIATLAAGVLVDRSGVQWAWGLLSMLLVVAAVAAVSLVRMKGVALAVAPEAPAQT